MKKIILTSASVLALGAAAPVLGQAVVPPECAGVTGNCSVIDATGTSVTTSVDQSGGTGDDCDTHSFRYLSMYVRRCGMAAALPTAASAYSFTAARQRPGARRPVAGVFSNTPPPGAQPDQV